MPRMTLADFIAKWRDHDLNERAAAQEHFIDLCHLVGHPTPASADPAGTWFTFERGVTTALGGEFIEPIKTTVVEDMRAMTTWVVRKKG